ncbi:MAG: ABC transporter permease [Clostridiaceae bacterium]|nr:ABC transporter permease [Clostridiaceae bacterium]
MILRSSYFMFRRLLRGYLSLVILLVTPLVLISVLGMVAGNAIDENLGIPIMDGIAMTLIVGFQLFGGFYTMEYMRNDLFTSQKWRMYSLPYSPHKHSFAILISSMIFSALQGLVMVIFTQQVFGVNWGNIGLILLILIILATLTQLVFISIVMGVKKYKTAERMGTAFGLVSMALAGVWFPMPKTGILGFLSTYGNPVSLGQNAVYAIMTGINVKQGTLSVGILIGASMAMTAVAISIGRRKLA